MIGEGLVDEAVGSGGRAMLIVSYQAGAPPPSSL